MEKYATIKDIADQYKVTEKTVRNWVKNGLPHIKIGNVLRFKVSEVEEYIKGAK